jgi:phosphatidylinositol N-acetylglucosaminyltransferase subunit H
LANSKSMADVDNHGATEESLLVLQGLGIQTSTSSTYFFTGPTTTFIPTTQIQDIVIHEAFKGLEVRFYLAVIVEGATDVVVVFPVCRLPP